MAIAVGLVLSLVGCGATGQTIALAGKSQAPSSVSAASTTFTWWDGPFGDSIPNNPYAAGWPGDPYENVLLPLAFGAYIPTSPKGPYVPELASSWKVTSSKITLHLRKQARWQNGAPFTATDVLDSLELAGAAGNPTWGLVSKVTTPNSRTVEVTLEPHTSQWMAFSDIIGVAMLPASQYGHLIPPGFEHDLFSYWATYDLLNPTTASVSGATNSPSGKAMSKLDATLVKFNPHTLLGDGPFKLVKATFSEILLTKWNGFWDAKKIAIKTLKDFGMGTSSALPAFFSGRMTFDDSIQLTDPQIDRIKNTNLHYVMVTVPAQQEGFIFNFKHYPFNLLNVRKAIAYVVNRTKLAELDVGGTVIQNKPPIAPDGISDTLAKHYLTKAQFAKLDHYNPDPSKAASLLRAAGFTKRGGRWYTPKGTPFTIDIADPAGTNTFDEDGIVAAQELTNFGIKSSSTDVEVPGFWTQASQGQFGMAEDWVDYGTGGSGPLSYFTVIYETYNYPDTYDGKGICSGCKPAINMPPIENVPGLGRVNLARTLNTEDTTTSSHAQLAKLTWDWARFTNEELPVLPIQNNRIHNGYNSAGFTWPPPSSWLWKLANSGDVLLFSQYGYLKPKK